MARTFSSFDQILVAGFLALSGMGACHYGLLGWMLGPPPSAADAAQTPTPDILKTRPALAPRPPSQLMPPKGLPRSFARGSYSMEAIADFEASALVLGAKHYVSDRSSDLSKVDLALAWGEMSVPRNAKALLIEQSSRFYRWRYPKEAGLTRQLVEEATGNMHLIAATPEIELALLSIARGDLVSIKGKLVNVSGADGWRWLSSTSRTDTGAGACEVILVSEVRRQPGAAAL